jgi:hypothetical protein
MAALRILDIGHCSQRTLTDTGIGALAQSHTLQELDMRGCEQDTMTDAALVHLSRCAMLTRLNLECCKQSGWSAAGVVSDAETERDAHHNRTMKIRLCRSPLTRLPLALCSRPSVLLLFQRRRSFVTSVEII